MAVRPLAVPLEAELLVQASPSHQSFTTFCGEVLYELSILDYLLPLMQVTSNIPRVTAEDSELRRKF
jgi:hypothetical protein